MDVLIKQLLDALGGDIPKAYAVLDVAATKDGPRDYIAGVIRNEIAGASPPPNGNGAHIPRITIDADLPLGDFYQFAAARGYSREEADALWLRVMTPFYGRQWTVTTIEDTSVRRLDEINAEDADINWGWSEEAPPCSS